MRSLDWSLTMNRTGKQLAVIAALAFSSAAFAQGYGGVALGVTKFSVDCGGTSTCDETDTGGKIFGGVKFTPNWGAELSYFDFGKANATLGAASSDIKASAFGAGVAFSGVLNPGWTGVARLGLARVKTKVSVTIGGLTASDSENSTKAYYGFGIGYTVMPKLSIDAAADFSKWKFDTDSDNVRLLSIGLTYSF
jgi:OmpA-OmpF porin, OOP family